MSKEIKSISFRIQRNSNNRFFHNRHIKTMLYELSPKILLNIYYYKMKTYLIEIRIKYTNEFHILLLVFAFYHLFNCFIKILQLLEDLINWTSLFYYGQKTSKFIMIPDYC